MRAFYRDDDEQTAPGERHEGDRGSVSIEELNALDLECYQIPSRTPMYQQRIEEIGERHDCVHLDTVTLSHADTDPQGEYWQEHLHPTVEFRYIEWGRGYFDVRDQDDDWIRILASAGDLIVIPAGMYHRFALQVTKSAVRQ